MAGLALSKSSRRIKVLDPDFVPVIYKNTFALEPNDDLSSVRPPAFFTASSSSNVSYDSIAPSNGKSQPNLVKFGLSVGTPLHDR